MGESGDAWLFRYSAGNKPIRKSRGKAPAEEPDATVSG